MTGKCGKAEDFSDANLKNQDLHAVASKVKIVESAEFNKLRRTEHKVGAKLTVMWNDGQSSTATVTDPKGTMGNPLKESDFIDKFHQLSSVAIGEHKSRILAELILSGTEDATVEELAQLVMGRD